MTTPVHFTNADAPAHPGLRVQVAQGALQGTVEPNGTRVWRGIPFAEPPLGALRGRAPQPPRAWQGVRLAEAFGSDAVQQRFPAGPSDEVSGSEDCLYLNVWAPQEASATPRPVMVWLHGGAFVFGSGAEPLYHGADYAARGDLLFVTVNYRLGGFGYLLNGRDPASANLGLLDQIAALQWVRDHIAAFGGDPGNVTLMGQSAGGMSIGVLLGTPQAKGLFHRAIVQSGGARPVYRAGEAQQVQALALARAGLQPHEAHRLMELSTVALNNLFIGLALQAGSADDAPLLGGEAFHPAIDGVVLPAHPLQNLAAVPTLIGHCQHESVLFAAVQVNSLLDGLPARTRALAGETAWAAIEAAYQATAPATQWRLELFNDVFTRIASLRLADALTAAGADVWSYRFDYAPAGPFGPCHSSDVAFTFGAPAASPIPPEWTDEADALSKAMRDSFIAFARHADPATEALPPWPRHRIDERHYLRFDAVCRIDQDFIGPERRAAWAQVPIDAL